MIQKLIIGFNSTVILEMLVTDIPIFIPKWAEAISQVGKYDDFKQNMLTILWNRKIKCLQILKAFLKMIIK